MTGEPRSFGEQTENDAVGFLRGEGYRIIDRNVRFRRGEIDLVAYEGEVLVFVEVKGRRNNRFGGARWAVDERKQKRIGRLAREYLARKRVADSPCRFDLVLVQDGSGGKRKIELIRNAFDATGE
ncbi:MAG TPA: YraN family protein [Nitrospiria bacterium]